MKFSKSIYISLTILLSFLFVLPVYAEETSEVTESVTPVITYSTHVSDIGWTNPVSGGQVSGTTGQAKAVEAFVINSSNLPSGSDIEYQAHCTNIGWQGYKTTGTVSGTEGMALTLQAIQIRLTGDIAETNDVYYRTHVASIGWLDWAVNDQVAGTTGIDCPVEALEIVIQPKSQAAPGATTRPNVTRESLQESAQVQYQGHIQNTGWSGVVENGQEAGTTGQGRALEAMVAGIPNISPNNGGIIYQTYNVYSGWTGWHENNDVSGNIGNSDPIEAFQVVLSGEAAIYYDVYYQAHTQDYGWLGWAKNGELAGSMLGGHPVEAFRIQLVPKNNPAPGSTENAYIITMPNTPEIRLNNMVNGPVIYVSIKDQKLYYYNQNNELALCTIVTTGTPNSESATPTGNFTLLGKSRNVTLVGSTYRSFVHFWMPFIGQTYGLHDADGWRDNYGPGVYLWDGSHGCVNIPYQAIATLFNITSIGTPIIIR